MYHNDNDDNANNSANAITSYHNHARKKVCN